MMSSADFLLAGYAAIQLVASSRATSAVVWLTLARLVESRLTAKTESEVTKIADGFVVVELLDLLRQSWSYLFL